MGVGLEAPTYAKKIFKKITKPLALQASVYYIE